VSANAELSDHIPVIKTTISGTRLVGRMTVGNKNGLLLPNSCSDQEMMQIRNRYRVGVAHAHAWGWFSCS
jgi:translation initiation factor 6 (eIF-6)